MECDICTKKDSVLIPIFIKNDGSVLKLIRDRKSEPDLIWSGDGEYINWGLCRHCFNLYSDV